MSWKILSPIIIVAWATCIVVLERLFPADKHQKLFRPGFFTDFFWYTLVQSYLLGLLITLLCESIDASTGFSRLRIVSDWPVLAQLGFFWVTHDFYIYWFHRLQHNNRYLWRIHEAHHSGKDVDWLSGSRSHAVEIIINQTIEYAPILLLGAPPELALMKGTLDATWGMYIHSNINVKAGWLQYVLNGPEMHRWHHSSHVTEGGLNYATKIAAWDWLFGSAYLPKNEKPKAYGLSGGVDYPEERGVTSALTTYFEQHAYSVRRFDREAEGRGEAAAAE